MTIQYASDLHLEFPENKQFLSNNPLQSKGDVLLLAGDIVPFCLINKHARFFDFVADHFETTYWVPGNHEYYHFDLADRCDFLQEKIRSNIWLVNNVAITQAGVRLIFSTLWTQIGPVNQQSIQKGMADFQVIRYRERSFNPHDYNEQHGLCLNFLKSELAKKAERTIAVTHHVPTLLNYPEPYRGSVLNEAFAVELFDLIESSGVNYWIYGHHHQPVPAFRIGSTSLISNQLGYVRYHEHYSFKTGATFEL